MKSLLPISTLALLPLFWLPLVWLPRASRPHAQDSVEAPPALLQAVPPDAVLFVNFTDLAGMRADAEQNAWSRMLRDEQFVQLWNFFREQATSELDAEKEARFEREFPLFLESMQGAATFFIAGSDLEDPDFGLLVRPGPGSEAFEEFVDQVVSARTQERTYADYEQVALALFEEDGDGPHGVNLDFELEGVWCFLRASTRDAVLELAHGAIDRLRGSQEVSIESSPLLSAARAGSLPSRVEFFADTRRLVAAVPELADEFDADAQRVLELLGLAQITWVHGTLDLGPAEQLDLHLRLPTPAEGYLADWLAALGPLPRHLAALGPRDALNVGLYNLDVFAIWESAWDLFADLDPESYEQARSAFEGGLQQFGGLDLEGDLLARLTGELAIFDVPVTESEFAAAQGLLGLMGAVAAAVPPELRTGRVYITGLEDAEGVELFLEEALDAAGLMLGISSKNIASEEFQGFAVQSLALPVGFSFSWCFLGDQLVTSLYPSALRSVLALHGKQDAPSILTNELFAPYVEQHAGAAVLGLAPSETSARLALSTLEMLSSLGSDAGWDNVEDESPVQWHFKDAPIPDSSVPGRYLEGTMIFKLEHAARTLELSLMAR